MKFGSVLRTACALLLVFSLFSVRAPSVRAADLAFAAGLQVAETANRISDVVIPDSELARDATQFIRDSEGDFLFQHSARVYYWAALYAQRNGLPYDPELLYVAAMFHDYGLTKRYSQSHL